MAVSGVSPLMSTQFAKAFILTIPTQLFVLFPKDDSIAL
jgi:hypothetical protein